MWWGSSSAGPRSRREIRTAYSLLSEDMVALSGELGRARLENVRLGAMVDALAHEVGRARGDLTLARTDIAAVQRETAVIRPLVTDLMTENRELRGQLAANQQMIGELTSRLTDLLEAHLAATRALSPPGSSATSEPTPAPRPAIADLRATEQPATSGAVAAALSGALGTAAAGSADRLRLIRHAID